MEMKINHSRWDNNGKRFERRQRVTHMSDPKRLIIGMARGLVNIERSRNNENDPSMN